MVSAKRYWETLIKVMPKRAERLKALSARKQQLDHELSKFVGHHTVPPAAIITELKAIIGPGAKITPATHSAGINLNNTLRRNVWKVRKSTAFCVKVCEGSFSRTVFPHASRWKAAAGRMQEYSEGLLKGFKDLEHYYERELVHLNNSNFPRYLNYADAEEHVIKFIREVLERLSHFEKSLFGFVETTLKASGNKAIDHLVPMPIIAAAFLLMTIGIFAGGIAQYGFGMTPALLLTISMLIGSGGILSARILHTINEGVDYIKI